MRFWDSSAIVPLVQAEATTAQLQKMVIEDRELAVWWGTEVECASALARSFRERGEWEDAAQKFEQLAELARRWRTVDPSAEIKRVALRILCSHPLRAADALQLAAAVIAAGHQPHVLPFVSLDTRLRAAAAREGFPLLPA
ncbi:MAG: PIN domain-containing protein [Terriglobales bacterium]